MGAQGFSQPDLTRALGDGNEHDIHDPDPADDQADCCNGRNDRGQCADRIGDRLVDFGGVDDVEIRITSYNVCYTKLLRDNWRKYFFCVNRSKSHIGKWFGAGFAGRFGSEYNHRLPGSANTKNLNRGAFYIRKRTIGFTRNLLNCFYIG